MTWPLSSLQEARRLERAFSNRRIPFEQPGFFDHPNFIEHERKDARFLELYARYVEARQYAPDYLVVAERKIEIAARALERAIADDGRMGACVDASGMLARMLDRLGVWNYVAKATLTISFPEASGIDDRYFWVIDEGEFTAAHAVVVAPPFGIVDVTVRHQPYTEQEAALVPPITLAKEWQPARWTESDLANHAILGALAARHIPFEMFLKQQTPHMLDVMQVLPARSVRVGDAVLKYIVVAVGGTNEPLEEILGYQPAGRTAMQIYQQDIEPLAR